MLYFFASFPLSSFCACVRHKWLNKWSNTRTQQLLFKWSRRGKKIRSRIWPQNYTPKINSWRWPRDMLSLCKCSEAKHNEWNERQWKEQKSVLVCVSSCKRKISTGIFGKENESEIFVARYESHNHIYVCTERHTQTNAYQGICDEGSATTVPFVGSNVSSPGILCCWLTC